MATADVFKRITPITSDEVEEIDNHFRTWLVVTGHDRHSKDLFCTGCRESGVFFKDQWDGEDVYSMYNDYYNIHHGDIVCCPFCGREAEIVFTGKMGMQCKKMWQRVQVVVFHAEEDGWLSAQAFTAMRDYWGQEWDTCTQYVPRAEYLFRSGCALQRKRNHDFNTIHNTWYGRWEQTETIYEPFAADMSDYWTGRDSREYIQIGLQDSLPNTEMRYSAADVFADATRRSFGLLRYLGEYCHRPQLEFAAKFDMWEIVNDLIYSRRANAHLVNWRATDLSGFLRLDKWCTKSFLQSNKSIAELEIHHELSVTGSHDVSLMRHIRFLNDIGAKDTAELRKIASEQHRNIKDITKYLMKQKSHSVVWMWKDYINMAHKLDYDLSEETVLFPKNLRERHDTAAATIEVMANKVKAKRLKSRTKKLKMRYEYADNEFAIIVPETVAAIVAEGKELHHCVGCYADRHCSGEATILFLRRVDDIACSYGTIEMDVTDDTWVKQLRGYHNCADPRTASTEFINKWRAWLQAGSPRDRDGKPIEAVTVMEVTA